MSEVTKVDLGPSSKLRSGGRNDESTADVGDGSTNVNIQDQVIIAPEIMKLILDHLDLQTLKQVRLTCKSWLCEAQAHVERRGIVRLYSKFSSTMIEDFINCRQKKALPQPFKSLDVECPLHGRPQELLTLMSQLSSLCQENNRKLVITRLVPSGLPLDLALPLILQCSTSLEYLQLEAEACKPGYLPPMDPEQEFPKLRHLDVIVITPPVRGNKKVHFAAIVAWIIGGCTNLETYEAFSLNSEHSRGTISELVLKSDITNVKNLFLLFYNMNEAAFDYFLSIPFTRLEDLRMTCVVGPAPPNQGVLIATVTQAATTLRLLNLSWLQTMEDLLDTEYEFPICPNVQELVLIFFTYSKNFLSKHFPSVQVINARRMDIVLEDGWNDFPAYENLKTLRIKPVGITDRDENHSVINGHGSMMFFQKFPGLECLGLKPVTLLACCSVKSRGDPQVSNMLEGVKHLELFAKDEQVSGSNDDSSSRQCDDYSLLATLKGVETITFMEFDQAVTKLPARDLPFLKLIQFLWVLNSDFLGVGVLEKLLEVASGVDKVAVTNCCSIPRMGDQPSSDMLKQFFESAPNAVCGCKESGRRQRW